MKITNTNYDPAGRTSKKAMDFIVHSSPLKGTAKTLRGLLFFMEAAMRKGKEAYSEQIDVETQFKQWEKRQAEKDARRFEEFVKEMRIKCGLEASNA